MSQTKMVVGLGNPGRRYENNRHNIGFRAVELYADRYRIDVSKSQSKALVGQGWVEVKQPLPKPDAPDNNDRSVQDPARGDLREYGGEDEQASGTQSTLDRLGSIFSSLNRQQADVKTTRVKAILVKPQTYMNNSGEAVQSLASYFDIAPADILVIHDHMDIPTGKLRLRPGGGAGGQNGVRSIISRLGTQDFPRLRVGVGRPPGKMDPAAYVLQDFMQKEAELFGSLADTVVKIIDTWLVDGIDTAMNQFNGKT